MQTVGTIQQELFSRAAEAARGYFSTEEAFRRAWPSTLVVLSGSAPTEFADKFSSIDLVAIMPDAVYEQCAPALEEHGLGLTREQFVEVSGEGVRCELAVFPERRVTRWLTRHDDFALGLFWDAIPVHDPLHLFDQVVGSNLQFGKGVLETKVKERYAELRRRQASMAWNLRRGQPFVFLDNLVRFMSHAFAVCFYLEGRPPVGKKWLFRGAMKTEVGRQLRPTVLDLFGVLGDLAVLGGTIKVRTSELYKKVATLQEILSEALETRGIDAH